MDITTEIFNVLNNDPESMKLLNSLNEAVKKHNATEEEYLKAREMILLAAVMQNKIALNMLADYVYTEINKGAN
jgi:hypothetical protein